MTNTKTTAYASRVRAAGFTLIEVMITVAIVAILAGVALPSYLAHVRTSNRAEAQAYMMTVATRQQQFLVDTRAFAPTLAALGVPVPTSVAGAYTLAMPAPGAVPPTFTLTLTPQGGQVQDKCGVMSIDQNGSKTAANARCW